MSKSTGSFLDWLLSRRRMRMRAHVVRRDENGNLIEEYDREMTPISEEEMFGEPEQNLMMRKELIKGSAPQEELVEERAQQEEPIKAKQQGVEVKPVSTEGFLTRLLEKRGTMEAPQKPVVKKEVKQLNIKEQDL